MISLQTERLLLKKLENQDAASLFQITGDPDVMKYWLGGADKDISQAEQRIAAINSHLHKYGFGDWGVFLKADVSLIGFAGLHYISDMTEVNIGYAFKKAIWRNGFAFEACQKILDVGFNSLQLAHIVAVIWPENLASQQLMRKCGFSYREHFLWKGSPRVLFERQITPIVD